jgi:abortive infection bacteriophage resistance protein
MTIKPIVPSDRRTQFNNNQNERISAALLTMQILLQRIWSTNSWAEWLRSLIAAHPNLPFDEMGIPDDWKTRKEWGFHP